MNNRVAEILKSNKVLVILILLVIVGVLIFDVFHYSSSYGIVEINSLTSLFLVPFIVLVCWLGMLLGSSKRKDDFESAYAGQITTREKEVISLVLTGMKNKEMSEALFVDISTIKSHLNNIYRKTGTKNRKELQYIAKSLVDGG